LAARDVVLATRFGAAAFFTVAFVPGLWATFTAFRVDGLEFAGLAAVAFPWTAVPFGADAEAGTMAGAGVAGT
jgi:hypothetical protein